jgi:hypothetical protein
MVRAREFAAYVDLIGSSGGAKAALALSGAFEAGDKKDRGFRSVLRFPRADDAAA